MKGIWNTFNGSVDAMTKSFITDLRPHKIASAMWQCAGAWNPTSHRLAQVALLVPVTVLALGALLVTWNFRSYDRKVNEPLRRNRAMIEANFRPEAAARITAFADGMHEVRHGA